VKRGFIVTTNLTTYIFLHSQNPCHFFTQQSTALPSMYKAMKLEFQRELHKKGPFDMNTKAQKTHADTNSFS
jgi:hypothetical protein